MDHGHISKGAYYKNFLENFNNFSNVLFEAVKSSNFSRVKEREGFRRELISVRDYNCMYFFVNTSRWTL